MKLLGKTLTQLQDLLKKKEISSKELFDYFLNRSKKYNGELKAFLTFGISNSKGVPIAIKDNFCTKEIRATASSKVLDDFIPAYNATVVDKLIKAEFSILGKTNMDAWAHGASTETSDYGLTRNPWNLERYPGGSSGGSAAAVASYLAPVAIGSDTGGSIRHPAAWCGVVGLKPTYGRVSRYGVVAMGSSFDCPGPMAQSVEDIAILLQILAGKDPFDATTENLPVPNYLTGMKKKKKLTIGVAEDYFEGVSDDIKKAVNEAINTLKKLGHTIKKVKLLSPKYSISVYTILQRAEVSSNLARYDGIRFGNDRTNFGQEAKRRIMLGTYTLSYGYYDAYYKNAQKVRTLIIDDFARVFKEVDLVIGPNTPVTALKIGEFEKYPFFGELMDQLNEPASVAGIPAISIPVGLDRDNLPIGMQIMGRQFDEESVLNLAYQYEKETEFQGITKKLFDKFPD